MSTVKPDTQSANAADVRLQTVTGRIPVTDVQPVVLDGRFPAKAVVGEDIPVRATVFREGHDSVRATVRLLDPAGAEVQRVQMRPGRPGLDEVVATLRPAEPGLHQFVVEGWDDPVGTWKHAATVKIAAGVDVELMLAEGAALFRRAAEDAERSAEDRAVFEEVVRGLEDESLIPAQRLASAESAEVSAVLHARPVREHLTSSELYPLDVQRELAGRGAWYEFFPRSEGARFDEASGTWSSGTFATAADRLPAVARMGFQVVYLPPIHPIGTTHRKGPNNTLTAGPQDPGSPWAIGAAEGGHDAVHPDLGTIADFEDFVAAAADEGLEVALDLALQSLRVTADRLAMGPGQSNFTLAAAGVQGNGKLDLKGVFTPQPLTVKTAVDLSGLNVATFAPYAASSLNATVRAITLGAKGNAEFAAAAGNAPMKAGWKGGVEITDVDLQDRVNNDDFLNWKRLGFSGMDISVAGDKIGARLGDIALEDFYGRVLLNAQGRLNVMDLVAAPGQAGGSITQDTQTPGRNKAPPAAAPAKGGASAMPDIAVNSVTLNRGRMTFTDRFVKPNYVAELSSIEGSITAVSSTNPQPAKVKVTGRVYTTAPLSISGIVQPFAKYLTLDLKATAKGVDLPRFNTYSAKYVGYPIKRGKLSVDLEYKIKDRALQATNHVILNQLTFGDKTNSPDATKLPVLLAVALLKDARGNIDINLPVSGSLDDPQFSVGGIVVRVLMNLVVKAVTSPFSLLASAFGGGEELSYVEFAPGSAALTEDSVQRIDTLTKALADRPALKMDISGRADPKTDMEGLRQAWVDGQIRAAKAADTAPRGKKPNPAGVQVSAAERAKYLEEVYDDTDIEDKPRNFIGIAKSVPAEQMEAMLRKAAPVGEEQLRQLADARAQAVYEKLQAQEGLADRVFIVAPQLDADGIKDEGLPSRVDFSLK